MKTRILLGTLMVALAGMAQATLVASWDSSTLNTAITDGSTVGITASQTFSGLDASAINGVDVRLHISGGYNGDLYGYLVLQDANSATATAILLNRVGTSGGDPFGSAGSGFDVTLSDTGSSSIHSASGSPTGTWQADQTSTLESTFGGLTANGTWTLFLADLSGGGGQSSLVTWGLDVSVVPEPITWALIICGAAMGLGLLARRTLKPHNLIKRFTTWVDAV
jgi:subtilisin-like proprotein convertase family protein